MHFALAFSLVALVSSLHGVLAQVQSATIFQPGGSTPNEALAGEVIGVGADGTTYVVSNVQTASGGIPFTETVVQGASQVSVVAVNPVSSGASLSQGVQCSLSASGFGDCVLEVGEIQSGSSSFATATVSGMLTQLVIPVSTASGFSTSATGSAASSSQASAASSATPTSSGTALKFSSLSLGAASLMPIAAFFLL